LELELDLDWTKSEIGWKKNGIWETSDL